MSLPTVTVSLSVGESEVHAILAAYLRGRGLVSGEILEMRVKEESSIPPEGVRDTHRDMPGPKNFKVEVVYRPDSNG